MAEQQKDQWAVLLIAIILFVVCVAGLSGVGFPKGNYVTPSPPRKTYTEMFKEIDWKQAQLDAIQRKVDDIDWEVNYRQKR